MTDQTSKPRPEQSGELAGLAEFVANVKDDILVLNERLGSLEDVVQHNAELAAASKSAAEKKFRHCHICGPGYQCPDRAFQFCPDQPASEPSPRPEWLPDDAEHQLMNTVLTGPNLVSLITYWFNNSAYAGRPWLQINEKIAADLGQRCNQLVAERDKALVDLKFAKHDAETCAAERDKAIQEWDEQKATAKLADHFLGEMRERAEAAEAKVARVQAYAVGLTKGNSVDRCRSAEILAVLDDTVTEVSGG